MTDITNWKCIDEYQLRTESEVPEAYAKQIFIAVRELIPSDEDDYEEGEEVYLEDYDDELPYGSKEDFSSDYLLHPLTFSLMGSESHVLKVKVIDAGFLGTVVSVYVGPYGYLLQGETLLAINEQGNIGMLQKVEHDTQPSIESVLRELVVFGAKDQTYKDLVDAN